MNSTPPSSIEELLSRYASGERIFAGAEFSESRDLLSGVCLNGVDFTGAFLDVSFKGASLREAVFRNSNLKTCDFSGADLSDSDFRGAGLCSAIFTGARLAGARFEGAFIHSHTFKAGKGPDAS